MKKRLTALAVMSTAILAAMAPTAVQAAPAPASEGTVSGSVQSLGRTWQYYGAYGSEAQCVSVGYTQADIHQWFSWHCLPDFRDGRTAYELWHYDF